MKARITATEAARKFSEILSRVAYKGESFVVERIAAERAGLDLRRLRELSR